MLVVVIHGRGWPVDTGRPMGLGQSLVIVEKLPGSLLERGDLRAVHRRRSTGQERRKPIQ